MNNLEKLSRIQSSLVHRFRLARGIAFSLLALTLATVPGHNSSIYATSPPPSSVATQTSTLSNPQVLTQPGSARALAVETITLKSEPFSPVAVPSFSSDNRNRITLFARNLDLLPTDNFSSVIADAEDGTSQLYPLTVEYVGKLPQCDEISFVIVRLNDQLGDVGDVLVKLSFHGLVSNRVRLGIGHIGGGPPDDPSPSPTPTPYPSPTPGTTHIITGQVVDSNGNALGGVTVNLADPAGVIMRSTVSTASGTFSFNGLATGLNGTVRAVPTLLLTFSLMTFTNLSADASAMLVGTPRLYSVSGRVVSGASGLSNATITCNDGHTTSSAFTDANGNYSFTQLTAGRNIMISAAKAGYLFANGSTYIPNLSSDRTTVDFTATLDPLPTPTPTPTPGPSPPAGSPPTDPNSTGYSWSNMTCVQNGGVNCSNGTIGRNAPGSGYGMAYAQSNEQIAYGTGAIALRVNSTSDVLRFGLTNSGAWNISPLMITTPVGTTLTGPTFGIALTGSGNLQVWEQQPRNVQVGQIRMFYSYSCESCVQVNDWLMVYSDEGGIKYYRDRGGVVTLLYSSDQNPVEVSYPLLPQLSISSNGSQADVKVLQPKVLGDTEGLWVSPTGATYAAGTPSDPSLLTLALNGKRPASNRTVILKTGTYNVTTLNSSIAGTATQPVTIRGQNQNVWPPNSVIDNGTAPANLVVVTGSYQIWRDIRFTKSDPSRISNQAGPTPTDIPRGGGGELWTDQGTGNKLVNSLVDNGVNGINAQTVAQGTEVYGVVSQNNGWSGTDRGHGHGIYLANNQGAPRKYVTNSVFLNNYASGYNQVNSNGGAQANVTNDGVVTMNNSVGDGAWVVVGASWSGYEVKNSHLYKGSFLNWGGAGGDLTFNNNYFYALGGMQWGTFSTIAASGNMFITVPDGGTLEEGLARPTGIPYSNYQIRNNTIYRGRTGPDAGSYFDKFHVRFQNGSVEESDSFVQWQAHGLDSGSTYYRTANEQGTPFSGQVGVRRNQTDVFVYPNAYQPGRALVVIWNWPLANSVTVNLAGAGLVAGQKFDLYSIQSGKKLISQGTYSPIGPTISVPMNNDDPPLPRFGDALSTPASTMPEFGAFLVIPSTQ